MLMISRNYPIIKTLQSIFFHYITFDYINLSRQMYDGHAFAGLYIRKEYNGPGTQKERFSKENVHVHPC